MIPIDEKLNRTQAYGLIAMLYLDLVLASKAFKVFVGLLVVWSAFTGAYIASNDCLRDQSSWGCMITNSDLAEAVNAWCARHNFFGR